MMQMSSKGFLLVPFLRAKVKWASSEFDYTKYEYGYTRDTHINPKKTPKNVPFWSIQQASTSWQRIQQSSFHAGHGPRKPPCTEIRWSLSPVPIFLAYFVEPVMNKGLFLLLDRTFFGSSDAEKTIWAYLSIRIYFEIERLRSGGGFAACFWGGLMRSNIGRFMKLCNSEYPEAERVWFYQVPFQLGDKTKTLGNWFQLNSLKRFWARHCGERRGVANVARVAWFSWTKSHPVGRRLLQTDLFASEPKQLSCFWGGFWARIRRTFRHLWSMRLSIPTSKFGSQHLI